MEDLLAGGYMRYLAALAVLLAVALGAYGCTFHLTANVLRYTWDGPEDSLQKVHATYIAEANEPFQGLAPPVALYKGCMEKYGYKKVKQDKVSYPARVTSPGGQWDFTVDEQCLGDHHTCIWIDSHSSYRGRITGQ